LVKFSSGLGQNILKSQTQKFITFTRNCKKKCELS